MPELARAYASLGDEVSEFGNLLELVDARRVWHADAGREHPDVDWFAQVERHQEPAIAICTRCLVNGDCLAWSREQDNDLAGFWAGTTEQSRKQLRLGWEVA